MATTDLISPYSLEAIDAMLRQKRAMGQYVSDATTRSAFEGALEAQAQKALQEQALAERRREFQQELALRTKKYEDERRAQMWQGIFGGGSMLARGYDWLTSPRPGPGQGFTGPSLWNKITGNTPAVPDTGLNMTPNPAWGKPYDPTSIATTGGAVEAAPGAVNVPGFGGRGAEIPNFTPAVGNMTPNTMANPFHDKSG